jgi:hypothetical protein
LYGEETAFMDINVFLQVMVPLIEMEGCVLIMISTLVNKYNFYTKLLYMIDPTTNKPLINSYVCELVCAACKRRENPTTCRHMSGLRPWWKKAGGVGIAAALYGANKELLARESMGVIIDSTLTYFNPKAVERLQESAPLVPARYERPRWVMVTCDPNAGGENHCAFTAMVYYRGYFVVRCRRRHCTVVVALCSSAASASRGHRQRGV